MCGIIAPDAALTKCNSPDGAEAGTLSSMTSQPPPANTVSLAPRTLVALCMLNHTALTGSRVAVSLSALAMGFSALQVGLLLSLFSLLPTLGAVWMGRWVDGRGTRVPALTGMTATCIGLVLPAWQPQPAMLWLAAALVGGGYSTSLLALQSQLGRWPVDAERAKGFSSFALATAVSAGLGPFVAGQSLAWGGTRTCFALLAAIATAAWVGGLLQRTGLDTRSDHAGSPRGVRSLREVLRDSPLRRILILDLLMALGWNANTFIVPIHGTQQGWTAGDVGNLLATFAGAVLLVRAIPAAQRQRLGDWRIIRLALGSCGACFLLFPFASGLPFAFLLEFMMGIGLGGALPSVLALLRAQSPVGRDAEVLGVRLVALNLSAVVLPLCLGGLGASVGLVAAMWALGTVLSVGAAAGAPPSARRASSAPADA